MKKQALEKPNQSLTFPKDGLAKCKKRYIDIFRVYSEQAFIRWVRANFIELNAEGLVYVQGEVPKGRPFKDGKQRRIPVQLSLPADKSIGFYEHASKMGKSPSELFEYMYDKIILNNS